MKLLSNLTNNIINKTKGPKLKKGQIRKIMNSLNVVSSMNMPKKCAK